MLSFLQYLQEWSTSSPKEWVDAFLDRREHRGKGKVAHHWTDGNALYLYNHKIAWHGEKPGQIWASFCGYPTNATSEWLSHVSHKIGGPSLRASRRVGKAWHGEHEVDVYDPFLLQSEPREWDKWHFRRMPKGTQASFATDLKGGKVFNESYRKNRFRVGDRVALRPDYFEYAADNASLRDRYSAGVVVAVPDRLNQYYMIDWDVRRGADNHQQNGGYLEKSLVRDYGGHQLVLKLQDGKVHNESSNLKPHRYKVGDPVTWWEADAYVPHLKDHHGLVTMLHDDGYYVDWHVICGREQPKPHHTFYDWDDKRPVRPKGYCGYQKSLPLSGGKVHNEGHKRSGLTPKAEPAGLALDKKKTLTVEKQGGQYLVYYKGKGIGTITGKQPSFLATSIKGDTRTTTTRRGAIYFLYSHYCMYKDARATSSR